MKRKQRYKATCRKCNGDSCKFCKTNRANLIARQILSSVEKLVEYSKGK